MARWRWVTDGRRQTSWLVLLLVLLILVPVCLGLLPSFASRYRYPHPLLPQQRARARQQEVNLLVQRAYVTWPWRGVCTSIIGSFNATQQRRTTQLNFNSITRPTQPNAKTKPTVTLLLMSSCHVCVHFMADGGPSFMSSNFSLDSFSASIIILPHFKKKSYKQQHCYNLLIILWWYDWFENEKRMTNGMTRSVILY